ncbi:MAG: mRNA interferase MazF [Thermotogaceae bacterium]|nr:mRNA interferase MazF [Thermotogaceae bacterium]
MNDYIPKPGDIVFLDFDPQKGHEQKGQRPALIISNDTFNHFTKLSLVCPITNTNRDFPLHVNLNSQTHTTAVVMCEQVKSLDIYARNVCFVEKIPKHILAEVLDIVLGFTEIIH